MHRRRTRGGDAAHRCRRRGLRREPGEPPGCGRGAGPPPAPAGQPCRRAPRCARLGAPAPRLPGRRNSAPRHPAPRRGGPRPARLLAQEAGAQRRRSRGHPLGRQAARRRAPAPGQGRRAPGLGLLCGRRQAEPCVRLDRATHRTGRSWMLRVRMVRQHPAARASRRQTWDHCGSRPPIWRPLSPGGSVSSVSTAWTS